MKIITMALYDIKKLLRDKGSLLLMILLPVVFTLIFGGVFGGSDSASDIKLPVGISNHDSGTYSAALIKELEKSKNIYIKQYDDNALSDKVGKSEVVVGFIIPDDFSKDIDAKKTPEISTLKLPTSADFVVAQGEVMGAFSRMKIRDAAKVYFAESLIGDESIKKEATAKLDGKIEENLNKVPVISVEKTKYTNGKENTNYNNTARSAVGVAVMFVMFTLVMGAGEILEEKKTNTWGRLSTTPTSMKAIILGKITGTFLKGWAQIGFLIVFGMLVLNIKWGNNILITIGVMSIYLLSVTSLGLFLSSIVKTNSQLGAFSSIIIVCSSMLAGCYWPIDFVPDIMQKIARLFPQFWAMKGLGNSMDGNFGFEAIGMPVIILGGMGILFFILSVIKGGFHRPTAKTPSVVEENFVSN